MKDINKEPRKWKARRDIVKEDATVKKPKKNKKMLFTLLYTFLTLIIALVVAFFIMSPSIDTQQNPFSSDFMDRFGAKEAYNFTNVERAEREVTLGTIYTLEDFFGKGFLVGELTPDKIIRNKNAYNVMVVGKDRVGANTDVIMIVNFNAETQEANVLQVPRDTYVEDEINKNSSKRINAIYAFAYSKALRSGLSHSDASHQGLQHLEKCLESTFGITIDNYFMIDLNGFVKIIDSIGGVEVNVPVRMKYDDDEQNLHIDLQKGLQTLSGEQSEQFVRFRNTYVLGDLGRVSAQKIFMSALVNKLLSPEWYSIESLSDVASNVIKYSTTGMTLSDLIGFVKKINFGKFSADNITFFTAQGEGFYTAGGASMYSLYLDENLEIINKAFNLYNHDVTESNVTLSQQYRSAYAKGDTHGSTSSEIQDEPPKISVGSGSSSIPTPNVPSTENDEPIIEGDEPIIEGDEPIIEGDEPIIEGDEPIIESDEPIIEGDEPIVEGDEPIIEGDEPIIEGDEPIIEGDEPVSEEFDTPVTDEEPSDAENSDDTYEEEENING